MDQARAEALPYLSRRRALPEREEVLADAPWPQSNPPTRTTAEPRPEPSTPPVSGAVRYCDLWCEGMREHVEAWLVEAQSALRAGKAKGPPSLILPVALALQPWAQKCTWDCRDPLHCAARRSHRPTPPTPRPQR